MIVRHRAPPCRFWHVRTHNRAALNAHEKNWIQGGKALKIRPQLGPQNNSLNAS
jgi:hypothetical protein